MNIPYIQEEDEDLWYTYTKLKPTGRWALKSGPYYENKLFIEHKALFHKKWIPEDHIVFLPEEQTTVFTCPN